MSKKKILVTGGAGFIGSHLCEELIKNESCEVWSLDDYSTGTVANHIPGTNYIRGNTKDIEKLVQFVPDLVYHLGEYSRVEQSFQDINTVWQSNAVGTFNVLQFCKKHACKLVYAGSSTKFGDGGLGRSQTPYGWTKAANTELVMNFGNWFDLPYAIVYFYNAYGPREISTGKYATLIALLRERMRKGESLNVVSPGQQRRNFTYVKDIVNGLLLVGENGYGDEFGIGSAESYTVLEIAEFFGGEIKMIPERRGNRLTADVITDKTTALGWKPEMSIKTYIEQIRNQHWVD
jgi:UDP-glucose 4-epimerase